MAMKQQAKFKKTNATKIDKEYSREYSRSKRQYKLAMVAFGTVQL